LAGWLYRRSRCVAKGNRAPKQAKVVAAKAAPVGMKQPSKSSLKTVPRGYASEIDGFAMRAATGEESDGWTPHKPGTSALAALDGIV
jgi:hypothetical protein